MPDAHAFMEAALQEAEAGAILGEVPVGAVLAAPTGEILARAHNLVVTTKDPTAHAELLVIRESCRKLGNERLSGCDLYVSLEPCAMCAGAISFARIRLLTFGASDPKGGAIASGVRFFESPTCHHRPQVQAGVEAERSAALLRAFFEARRR